MDYVQKICEKLDESGINDLLADTKLHYDTKSERNGRIIMSNDLSCRYYYSEEIKNKKGENRENKITIIMFNPAKANLYKSDKTIDNTYRIIRDYTNYKEFEIFNLFNIRNSNPACQKETDIKTNFKLLKELLSIENNPYVLLAWGGLLRKELKSDEYKCAMEKLNGILNSDNRCLYIVALTKDKHPMHLSSQNKKRIENSLKSNNDKLISCSWNEIR